MLATDRYTEEVLSKDELVARYAHGINLKTYDFNPAVAICPLEPGNFRGRVGSCWKPHIHRMFGKNKFDAQSNLVDWTMLDMDQCDGLGGKPQFFTLIGTPEIMRRQGHDLLAMSADDLRGALPTIISNVICFKRITEENLYLAQALFDGYLDVLEKLGIASVTGETAVMRNQITGFSDQSSDSQLVYVWEAACRGLIHRSQNWIEREVTSGMPIVGFFEDGHRCNANGWLSDLSLAYYGDVQSILTDKSAMRFIEQLTTPSVVYCKVFAEIMGWTPQGTVGEPLADVRRIVHISGYAWRKLMEALPKGIGAALDKMPTPAPYMLKAQTMSWEKRVPNNLRLTDEQGYLTLNGGVGAAIVAANKNEAEKVVRAAQDRYIKAAIIGETIGQRSDEDDGDLQIISRYRQRDGETIYPLRKTA